MNCVPGCLLNLSLGLVCLFYWIDNSSNGVVPLDSELESEISVVAQVPVGHQNTVKLVNLY